MDIRMACSRRGRTYNIETKSFDIQLVSKRLSTSICYLSFCSCPTASEQGKQFLWSLTMSTLSLQGFQGLGESRLVNLHTVTAPDWSWGDAVASKLIKGFFSSDASICKVVCPGAKKGDRRYWAWSYANCSTWLPVFLGVLTNKGPGAANNTNVHHTTLNLKHVFAK